MSMLLSLKKLDLCFCHLQVSLVSTVPSMSMNVPVHHVLMVGCA